MTKDEYASYLETDGWHARRDAARRRAGDRCQLCNTAHGALEVHHRTYERVGAEQPMDLTALCADCHAKFHDIPRHASETPADRLRRIIQERRTA
jgi:5-methylcytosine-specific restriction endonuclease McrA